MLRSARVATRTRRIGRKPMAIVVGCHCGATYQADERYAGHSLPCPACGQLVPICSAQPEPELRVACSCCGGQFLAAAWAAGTQLSCPTCGRAIIVSPPNPVGFTAQAASNIPWSDATARSLPPAQASG